MRVADITCLSVMLVARLWGNNVTWRGQGSYLREEKKRIAKSVQVETYELENEKTKICEEGTQIWVHKENNTVEMAD